MDGKSLGDLKGEGLPLARETCFLIVENPSTNSDTYVANGYENYHHEAPVLHEQVVISVMT